MMYATHFYIQFTAVTSECSYAHGIVTKLDGLAAQSVNHISLNKFKIQAI